MRHPAAYPDFRNPREVRSYMHTVYDRYVHGTDLFPKIRVLEPEAFASKSRAIARTLFREWTIIDEDNDYFHDMLLTSALKLKSAEKPTVGKIIAKAGRNAVNFAFIEMPGQKQPGSIIHGVQDAKSIIESLEGDVLRLTDGRSLTYVNGDLQPEPSPDGIIIRKSGASGIFIAKPQPESTAA